MNPTRDSQRRKKKIATPSKRRLDAQSSLPLPGDAFSGSQSPVPHAKKSALGSAGEPKIPLNARLLSRHRRRKPAAPQYVRRSQSYMYPPFIERPPLSACSLGEILDEGAINPSKTIDAFVQLECVPYPVTSSMPQNGSRSDPTFLFIFSLSYFGC